MARSRSAQKSAAPKRHTDMLRIGPGELGPVPRCRLEIRPFTVFIGRQGTGKSLIAQLLYFFEELPFLAAFTESTRRTTKNWGAEHFTTWILDQLRSNQQGFMSFAPSKVRLDWKRSAPYEWPEKSAQPLLTLQSMRKQQFMGMPPSTGGFIDGLRMAGRKGGQRPPHHAFFIPTERIVSSLLHSAIGGQLLSVPLTFTLFEDCLEQASRVASQWERGRPPSPTARHIAQIGQSALGGHAERQGDQWKWRFSSKGKHHRLDIDMASSGQRANWPLPYIAQTLFDMRESGDVTTSATLFVEEPEIHLHPSAQVEMVRILALLVNEGFRVVLTTHSLNVIYALNNFMQASQLDDVVEEGIPEPEVRLSPRDVSVYAFTQEAPRQLVDVESAFIDERELGEVAEDLAASLNRIGALQVQRGEHP